MSCYGNSELGKAWKRDFEFCPEVVISNNNILEIGSDAIASPGNSFGFMDGGLDLAISHKFGWEIQTELRNKIAQLPMKELLVGQAIAIKSEQESKYIICAPTMRVPSSNNIPTSVNAYLAMKAILIEAKTNKNITSVSISGLCTGTGKMPVKTASKQMFSAYEEIIQNVNREFPTFMDASKFQRSIDFN